MVPVILKPGPFKRIVNVHLNSLQGYGSFQWGTAIDSRSGILGNPTIPINVYCFVYEKSTFPSSWTVPGRTYALDYKDDAGAWISVYGSTFSARYFYTYSFMNNVVVAGRTLPPGPFLDVNGQPINYNTVGEDLDYGLLNFGYRFEDPALNGDPDYYMTIKNSERFDGKIIRITIA